jgi:hypothetical protein
MQTESKHIVLYAVLAIRLEVLMEQEFGKDSEGNSLNTGDKVPRSKITAGGLFGRYYKAVVGDNVMCGCV